MSKKAQPQKGENPKAKPQTVDEQNEPFLRALQKKVRNINKKLAEIAELQGKDNLKPEQIQKINRKEALVEEKIKVQENAVLFKQVYAENVAHYRNNQLRELQILARAIAVYHAAAKIPEQARLAALWQALQHHDNHLNLNAGISSLSTLLKQFANDRKLQKALTTYAQQHGNEHIKHAEIIPEKTVNDVVEEKTEKREPTAEQPPAKVEAAPLPQVVPVPVVQSQPEPAVEKAPEVPQVAVQSEATPIQEPATTDTQQPPEDKQGGKREYKPKDNRDRPYRGKGSYRGDNREGEGERRQYKPKFEERRQEKDSSSGQQEEARQFRRQEIKKLEDDGFIVVGKPKPKPKDIHEKQRNYEKQHGQKYHHHHQAGNRNH